MSTARQTDALCNLNHFYVVLDSATYRAMEDDALLRRDFAPNERRTTVRTDQTYTGLYFYGINTYFEVFDEANSGGRAVGDYGLAFGVDEAGGIAALRKQVCSDLEQESELITRLYEGQQIPWFYMATLTHFPHGTAHSSWVMEYHPEFLHCWNPRSGDDDGIRRRDILSRYRAVLAERVVDPILADVVGLTIAVSPATRLHLTSFCTAAGYTLKEAPNATVELHGRDIALKLVAPVGNNEGIREVEIRTLREPSDGSEKRFGRSTLHFTSGRAVLGFD